MATASASATQVRYLVETTAGTVESGNPQLYRVTKESLNQTIESQASQELRADRQVSDVTLVSGSVGGALDWELSLKTHDDFLEALLANTWALSGTTDGTLSVTAVTFTAASDTFSTTGVFPTMEKGQWFRVSGHSIPELNGVYRCSTTTAPTTTAIVIDTAVYDPGAVAATSSTATFSTSRLKNGTTDLKTFSIEKEFSDITPAQFFMATGMAVQSMSLNFATGEAITGSFSFLGMEMARTATTSSFPGIATAEAATTTPMINTVNNTIVVLDGAQMGDSCAESFSLNVNTGMKERRCLGSGIGLAGITQGTFEITADLNIFFGAASSAAVYDKMVGDLPVSFAIYCEDSNGDGYAISIERAKISSSEVVAGGINTDVMMNLSLTATVGSTSGAMIAIDRIGSVA